MTLRERVPLASLTTLRVGGEAALVAECESVDDIKAAIALARDRGLSWYTLGGGSNLLADDAGFAGVIIRMQLKGMTFADADTKARAKDKEEKDALVRATAHAGEAWDAFVRAAGERGLWGVENLAGIPGSVGAVPVQNVGAYGADVSRVIESVEALDTASGTMRTFTNAECEFGYRDSFFKHISGYIVTSVTFLLSRTPAPDLSYADLAARAVQGIPLTTPLEIAAAVRDIRAQKFPDLSREGTAGSFFKNPTISAAVFTTLKETYPKLPGYESADGIKISLAWILDNALSLRGYSDGPVRCFERQPLVIVAQSGATAAQIDHFARTVEDKVFSATGIRIEREVRALM